jgi:hypothetical protein
MKVSQILHLIFVIELEFVTGLLFLPGTPVSSTNKIDHHDINEILLKVALNIIILTLTHEFGDGKTVLETLL